MKSIVIVILILLVFTGCADPQNVKECLSDGPCGFWSGLWHGLVLPFSWIGSLFSDDIAIYAVNNNGGWYDFGFTLGVGGLSSSIKTRNKKDKK